MNKTLARIAGPFLLASALAVAPLAAGTASASPARPVQAYGPATCTFTVTVTPPSFRRGDRFTVTISGTCFGVTFTIQIHSVTDTLGTITTDSAGNGSASFVAPTNLPDGTHYVTATSPQGTSSAFPVAVAGGPYTGAATVTPAPSSSSGLPLTGADAEAGAAIGAGAVLVGGLLVLAARRRRATTFH